MLTFEEMENRIRHMPGYTIFPGWIEMHGDLVEGAQRLAAETDRLLEWSMQGAPRFMPKDEAEAESIRETWRSSGLDVADYGSPKKAK